MNKQRLIWAFSAAVVTSALAGAIFVEVYRPRAGHRDLPSNPFPSIELPEIIDVGQREVGEQVVVPFRVVNSGGGELIVHEVHTNCSCTGLERREGNTFVRVESLRLPAGAGADLDVRMTVRASAGGPVRNVAEFHTNDPRKPVSRLEIVVPKVTGGVFVAPAGVLFGTVAVGAEVRQIIDIHDSAVRPRSVIRVDSSDPSRVVVRLLPTQQPLPQPQPQEPGVPPVGPVIGRVEVVVRTDQPGPIDATVLIDLDRETSKPDALPVVGRVAMPVEAMPSSFVLPRAAGDGPMYSGTSLCRSTDGQPLSLTAESVPEGLTAQIVAGAPGASSRIVHIAWDPRSGSGPADGRPLILRFKATAGGRETILEIPVTIRGGDR